MAGVFDNLMGAFRGIDTQKLKDRFSTSVTPELSVHDKLSSYGGKDVADALYKNAPDNIHDSAASYTVNAKNAGDEELRYVFNVMDKHTGLGTIKTTLFPSARKEAMQKNQQLETEVYQYLLDAHNRYLRGEAIAPHPNQAVQEIAQAYQKSNFAANSLKRQADSGMDVSNIQESPYYVPTQWEYHKIKRYIGDSEVRATAVAKALGQQIAERFPALKAVAKLSDEQIGRSFMQTQKSNATRTSSVPFHGTTSAEAAEILKQAGVDDPTITAVMAQLKPSMDQAGKLKHHKRRIPIDTSTPHLAPDGSGFKLGDFVNTNFGHNLERYNITTSSRIGLAKKGFTEKELLVARLNEIRKTYEGDKPKYKEVDEFLQNVEHELLGYSTGVELPDWVRVLNATAASLHLKNSGIYNTVDYARIVQKVGYARVLKHFMPAFKGVLKGTELNPDVARRITDVITGQLTNEGKMRSVLRHMDDNFTAPTSVTSEWIMTAAQSVRFLNASEYIRRHQLNMLAGITGDYLEGLVKDSDEALQYFRHLNIPEARIQQMKQAVQEHGLYSDNWDVELSDYVATVLSSGIDDMALMVRKGELPPMLAYSAVGKILFPYFSFTAGANQKILRQTYRADGTSGLAITMIHQAPLALIAAASVNVLNGRDATENVMSKALLIAPTLGYLSFAGTAMDRGTVGSVATPFAPLNSAMQITEGIADFDPAKIIKNTPGVAVFMPTRVILQTFD